MNAPASITVTPVFVADLSVEGERMPVYVHVIDHPDARVLVDTGMTELHPAMADMDPRLQPLSEHELLPGLRLVPAPGHTPGMQMVVVETGGRPVIVGGDVAVWFGEFDEPPTEGRPVEPMRGDSILGLAGLRRIESIYEANGSH